jgi:hypothetical protein
MHVVDVLVPRLTYVSVSICQYLWTYGDVLRTDVVQCAELLCSANHPLPKKKKAQFGGYLYIQLVGIHSGSMAFIHSMASTRFVGMHIHTYILHTYSSRSSIIAWSWCDLVIDMQLTTPIRSSLSRASPVARDPAKVGE